MDLTFFVRDHTNVIGKINYQGVVTKHNTKLCQFELDSLITVHYVHKFKSYNYIRLPRTHEQVTIFNGLLSRSRRHIILTEQSNIVWNNNYVQKREKECFYYMELVYKFNIKKPLYFLRLNKLNDSLKIFTPEFCQLALRANNVTREDITVRIVSILLKANSELKEYNIKFPVSFKIDITLSSTCDTLVWNFGVYTNKLTEDYLVGHLRISKNFGFVVLQDSQHFIPCIIVPNDTSNFSEQMLACLDHFVLIKKYHVFEEYNKNYCRMNYLYINIKDIEILNLQSNAYNKFINKNENEQIVKIKILHKCELNIKNNQFQCFWICNNVDEDNSKPSFFIRLIGKHLLNYPALNRQDICDIISTNRQFISNFRNLESEYKYNFENRRLPIFTLPDNARIQLNSNKKSGSDSTEDDDRLLTIAEAHDYLKQQNKQTSKLVSFQGILVQKYFVEPYSGQTETTSNPAFGTPGKQVHVLILRDSAMLPEKEFDTENQDETTYLSNQNKSICPPTQVSIYLHNWDLLQCPFGLIPGMRVAILNVLPSKCKYFKPVFISALRPISYEPIMRFNTCPEEIGNWGGPMFYLGSGRYLPKNCVCWGPTQQIKVKSIKIRLCCKTCSQMKELMQISCCDRNDFSIDIMLVLIVTDAAGIAEIITKDEKILRVLLNFSEAKWNCWKQRMSKLSSFSHDTYGFCLEEKSDRSRCTAALQYYLDAFNYNNIHHFDLKCRKLAENFSDLKDPPKWYLIEARPSLII